MKPGELHASFISNTFLSNARLKLKKNQADAKQHPDVELQTKIIGHILKSEHRNKCVCIDTINHNESEYENEKWIP